MTTIEVTEVTRARLHDLAIAIGEPEGVIVEKAIERYRRETLLEATNAAYAALRADPAAWEGYQDELAEWDGVVADGLEAE